MCFCSLEENFPGLLLLLILAHQKRPRLSRLFLQMEPVVLSDKSCNAVGMDRLARSLAHRLHINYFDIKNKSQTHVLRHSRQTRPDTAFTEVTV